MTGHRFKDVCHIPSSGLEALLSDKDSGNGIRQGGSREKCLGLIGSKCFVPGD